MTINHCTMKRADITTNAVAAVTNTNTVSAKTTMKQAASKV